MSAEKTPQSEPDGLAKGLGSAVTLVAVLLLVSSLTRPAAETRAPTSAVLVETALLIVHASLYYAGSRRSRRVGLILALQVATLFAFGIVSRALWLNIALFAALTAHALRLTPLPIRASVIRSGALVIFAVSTALGSNVYRGATVALVLAVVSLVVQALFRPRLPAPLDPISGPEPPARDNPLSARELEVLRLAATGARSREMAERLAISERTVKAHLSSAYRKLDVESRAAAVARAAERGLI